MILAHEIDCLLVPPLTLLDAGGFLKEFINVELVHENHLVDLALVQNVVGIGVAEAQTFDKGLVIGLGEELVLHF